MSNWPAGVDLLFAVTGGIVAGVAADEGDRGGAAAGVAIAAVSVAAMVYGFAKSADCRDAHASANHPTRGAYHWLIPPAIVLTAGAVALAAAPGSSRASAPASQDSCEPGEPVTAQCNDGTPSCSAHRRGTCSSHGGVRTWYRYIAP